VLLRLLAPFLPFVTEEVWSWWHEGSIHRSPWPAAGEFPPGAGGPTGGSGREEDGGGETVLSVVSQVLGVVRRAKTTAKRSMRAPVARLTVTDDPARLALLAQAEGDLRDAGGIVVLETVAREGTVEPDVVVELGEEEDRRPGP
jgi:valyl-tRNA synthetase